MANVDDQATIDQRMERFSCDPFEKDKTTWDAYIFRFEQMCRAKSLGGAGPNASAARRTLLLAYVGPDALAAVRHHLYPDDVNERSYEEVKNALKRLYKPSLTIFAARLAFEKATRSEGETVTQFANRLRELSSACNYGNALDERLRDRFAAGANHSKFEVELRQRWPDGQEANAQGALVALAFQTVFELASAMERAENECKASGYDMMSGKSAEVHAIKRTKAKGEGNCPRCGSVGHQGSQCRHRKTKCFKCGRMGHLAKMCQEDTDEETDSESAEEPHEGEEVRSSKRGKEVKSGKGVKSGKKIGGKIGWIGAKAMDQDFDGMYIG